MDDKVSQLCQPLILLSRRDLAALMPFGAYVDAIAEAFRLHAQGRTVLPAPMHVPAEAGGFHVKAGGLPSGPGYVAFKVNANFPNNRITNGLPTIQGAILLFNSNTGSPVALLDSIEITIKRTGAATAVAARHLARPESRVATIVGCGEQGGGPLEALRQGVSHRRGDRGCGAPSRPPGVAGRDDRRLRRAGAGPARSAAACAVPRARVSVRSRPAGGRPGGRGGPPPLGRE